MENIYNIYERFGYPAADGIDCVCLQHHRLFAPCDDRVRCYEIQGTAKEMESHHLRTDSAERFIDNTDNSLYIILIILQRTMRTTSCSS